LSPEFSNPPVKQHAAPGGLLLSLKSSQLMTQGASSEAGFFLSSFSLFLPEIT
jgi:hypothetical protein